MFNWYVLKKKLSILVGHGIKCWARVERESQNRKIGTIFGRVKPNLNLKELTTQRLQNEKCRTETELEGRAESKLEGSGLPELEVPGTSCA